MTPPSVILSNAKDLVASTNAHQIFRFAQQLVFTTFRMTRKGRLSIINYNSLTFLKTTNPSQIHGRMDDSLQISNSERANIDITY